MSLMNITTMQVLIINIDSKYPNLALAKIARYHQDKGHRVAWDMPLLRFKSDLVYVSCLYTYNRDKCSEWEGVATIGGTGWDLHTKLPDEIEAVQPHINWGFTTRGCTRHCPWCLVPAKEGNHVVPVADLLDLWDGKAKKITLLDNNILALPDHFELVCNQAIKHHIRLDFNQGLDHRLLTPDICTLLKKVPHKEYRFSFDTPAQFHTVSKAITMLEHHGLHGSIWYVLVGFNTTHEDDLSRLNYLRDRKQNAYVQTYNHQSTPETIKLAKWANQHGLFKHFTYDAFCDMAIKYNQKVKASEPY